MASLHMNFDATQVKPNVGPPPPLPTDWYNVMITESEVKPTKDKEGGYLELTLKVLDGPLAGRQAWDRLNLWNKNPVAVEIAQGALSAICHAVGVFQVNDSSVLHGRPLMARIVEKPAEGGYDASNDVKGYAKVGDKESKNAAGTGPTSTSAPAPDFTPPWAAPAAPASAPAPAAPAPAPAADAPPWMKTAPAATGTPPWAR